MKTTQWSCFFPNIYTPNLTTNLSSSFTHKTDTDTYNYHSTYYPFHKIEHTHARCRNPQYHPLPPRAAAAPGRTSNNPTSTTPPPGSTTATAPPPPVPSKRLPASSPPKLPSAPRPSSNTTLIKYDPAKLTGLYGLMRKTERMHLVEDLRLDVSARTTKGRKWREVMVVARGMECEDPDLIWECLEMACQRAMDVGLELEERLRWCEREFEAEKLPAGAVSEERVWNEGLEIQRRESEEGISLE
jgi:hypothetical protein